MKGAWHFAIQRLAESCATKFRMRSPAGRKSGGRRRELNAILWLLFNIGVGARVANIIPSTSVERRSLTKLLVAHATRLEPEIRRCKTSMWRAIRSSIFILFVPLAAVSLAPSETSGLRLAGIANSSQPQLYKFSKLPNQRNGLTRALPASAAPAQGPTISDVQRPFQMGEAKAGEALFIGRIRLANGGPPCISCHSVSGLPFPNG